MHPAKQRLEGTATMHPMLRRTTVLAISLMAAGFLSACSTAPSMALERARTAVGTASADPAIARLAPLELKQATEALAQANGIWSKTKDEAETNHVAYMAALRAEMATDAARTRMLDANIRTASSGNDRISMHTATQASLSAKP
jgi:hypothetical protein